MRTVTLLPYKIRDYADNSLRTISAPALRAFNLPRATSREMAYYWSVLI